MIVAHVGPPTGRLGGPPGYLHQLKSAAAADRAPRHDVRFPRTSSGSRPPSLTPSPTISLFTRVRRKVFGPKYYRPPAADIERRGGVVDRLLRNMAADLRSETSSSLADAIDADVIFTHETFSAEDALARRRPGQQVWMMCHGVTPIALYAAWSWALPEADWRALMELPDVRMWNDWELGVWQRVDRFILPCPEAADSFVSIDPRFASTFDRAEYVLSGASAASAKAARSAHRDSGRIGLYLGSAEPYRGFDALVAGIDRLTPGTKLTIAVAGPNADKVPEHPRLRALGRVEDVAGLLQSVDFLINVNRFSLFDLSTIEAVEAGKPLLLHAVGGNRAFERIGAGCVMLGDLEPATIANGLAEMAALDDERLAAFGRESRTCWERQLTPAHMWDRHLNLYDAAAASPTS